MKQIEHKIKTTPKDFFLYLGTMVALYVSVISLLALLFQYVNVLFPDELDFYRDPYSSQIRWSIASLLIIFPVYVFLTRLLNSDLRNNPEKGNIWIRKWLIYLTLFVAAITIIVDLVVLVNTFLGGEITTRFILKIISILIVIGSVFSYYFNDLRGKFGNDANITKAIGIVVSIFVIGVIVGGFFIVGSPTEQRLIRFDAEKVQDLQEIQWQVINYWQSKEEIPDELSLLNDSISGFFVPIDRERNLPYEYRVISPLSFELCANFNRESLSEKITTETIRIQKPAYPATSLIDTWDHKEGRSCFIRTIDPDIYGPFNKR